MNGRSGFGKQGKMNPSTKTQVEHAAERIERFYHSGSYKVEGYFIDELVKSEYGVALLLDNHVNRPGYVKGCLRSTLKKVALKKPSNWGTSEEKTFLGQYLKIRKTYGNTPMTDAEKRAGTIQHYVANGIISDERNSFKPTALPSG